MKRSEAKEINFHTISLPTNGMDINRRKSLCHTLLLYLYPSMPPFLLSISDQNYSVPLFIPTTANLLSRYPQFGLNLSSHIVLPSKLYHHHQYHHHYNKANLFIHLTMSC